MTPRARSYEAWPSVATAYDLGAALLRQGEKALDMLGSPYMRCGRTSGVPFARLCYHAQAAHLTHYNHLFLWRYFAGFALALFLLSYWKVAKAFFQSDDRHHLVLFVLMTCTLIGSPTHLMIKWRPMHAAPLLGYQVYLAVIGWTLLLCYVVSRKCEAFGGKRGLALASLLVLNSCYCAYARPALLSQMSQEVFLGKYPDPRPEPEPSGISRTPSE